MNHKLILLIFLTPSLETYSQSSLDSLFNKIDPDKWSASVQKKVNRLEDKLITKPEETLHRLEKQEEKIYKKQLSTKDFSDSYRNEAKLKLADIKNKSTLLIQKSL